MRIIILQDYLRSGGTELQSVRLCREFQDAGASPMLLTFRPGGRLADLAQHLSVEHHSVLDIDLRIDILAPGLTKLLKYYSPRIVLCMGRVANSFAGFMQTKLPETAIVGTIRLGKPTIPRLNLWSFRRLPATIANTQWWKSRLVELGVESERIHVIPNGLGFQWDFSSREGVRAEFRRKLNASASDIVLLNVAGFRVGKRHSRLIQVVSQLPDSLNWKLWLIGDGPRMGRCQQLVRSLGVADRVHFAGYVRDPFPYYAGADIAVSLSMEDALPNFIVEAQSLALPVVASDYRGVSEALADGTTGYLVPPEEDHAFVEKLSGLMSAPAIHEQMAENARFRAIELYDSRSRARQYLDVFESFH